MQQVTAIVAVSPSTRKTLLPRRPTRLVLVRTPGGAIIGTIVLEGDQRVFVRRVTERIRFRLHDAWPLGAYALEQLVRWRVTLLRYLTPDGIYEVGLAGFIAQAIAMEFPGHPEVQHVLPRSLWTVRPVQLAQTGAAAIQEQLALTPPGEVSA